MLQLPDGWQNLRGPSGKGFSYYKDLFSCPRKSYHRSVEHLVPIGTKGATTVGSIVHLALAIHYKHQLPLLEVLESLWTQLPADITPDSDSLDEVQAMCLRLLSAYADKYRDDFDRFEVLEVEHLIETQIATIPVSTRVDLLIRDKSSGLVRIVDHKTAHAMTREFSEGFGFDGQLFFLTHCYKNGGLETKYGSLGGIMINAIVKTKVPQFKRLTYAAKSGSELERFGRNFSRQWGLTQDGIRLAKADGDLKGPQLGIYSGACKSPYLCDYLQICEHGYEVTQDEFRVEET